MFLIDGSNFLSKNVKRVIHIEVKTYPQNNEQVDEKNLKYVYINFVMNITLINI